MKKRETEKDGFQLADGKVSKKRGTVIEKQIERLSRNTKPRNGANTNKTGSPEIHREGNIPGKQYNTDLTPCKCEE